MADATRGNDSTTRPRPPYAFIDPMPRAHTRDGASSGSEDRRALSLPEQGMPHLLGIDLAGVVHRCFRACLAAGEPVRGAPTALRMLARALRGRQPTHVLFAAEGVGSLRRAKFPGYKAEREEPDGLAACTALVESALAAAGVAPVRAAGLEGDDVLAAAVALAAPWKLPVVLFARDKDVEQLCDVEGLVLIWDGDQRVLDAQAVEARWGVSPRRLPELFALAGDASDGVPGVPGWGKARAAELLNSINGRSLEQLLSMGGEFWAPKKFRPKLVAHRDQIRVYLSLVNLYPATVRRIDLYEDMLVDALAVAESLMRAADRLEVRR